MVSLHGAELCLPAAHFTETALHTYQTRYAHAVSAHDLYFGAWVDGASVYLDLSQHHTSHRRARQAARRERQRAYYDVRAGVSIHL
ncbi:hypothetical protein AB0G73_10660 [Streptomyces sp. NPDC020719]|uniref:hypothetical protein n=1 Tax=Streptomyces sp. NPDC020719 TaxID=3154896 RepID=UPI0034080759